ncbi:type 2 periplasmic-binding domain-containing protein [Pseudoroseomonas ludipueritiae]|uniref:hypothetical protein n=1 Tax=Pseudoroseomonas ludipueritiae TaxID=198093 RepID=UPI001887D5E6
MRFTHPHPESDSRKKAARLFRKQLKERADGAVTAQVFGNGVLGSGQASTAPARGGTPDIASTAARVEKAR